MPDAPSLHSAPVSPGDVLQKDYIARRGVTQERLAAAMGVSRYSVNQLVNDRRNVTAEMALRLARVFGTTPEFWMDLQRDMDLQKVREAKGAEIDRIAPLFAFDDAPPLASMDALFPDD